MTLPRHLIVLLQEEQQVVRVDEKAPAGQAGQHQDQNAPLQNDSHSFQVLTAERLQMRQS